MENNIRPLVTEHNVVTDIYVTREMNDEEYQVWLADKAESEQVALQRENQATIKAAAEAKLAALGLTSDDLKALGLN
jgi:hypothetical protein